MYVIPISIEKSLVLAKLTPRTALSSKSVTSAILKGLVINVHYFSSVQLVPGNTLQRVHFQAHVSQYLILLEHIIFCIVHYNCFQP